MNRRTLALLATIVMATATVGWSKDSSPEASAPHQGSEAKADEKPSANKADHAHKNGKGHGPHDGVLTRLGDGLGFAEVKLHDDKGDLEVWLAKDEKILKVLDLPLDAEIKVVFTDKDDKLAILKVRNTKHNEDEDGTPNIRDGKTNYFIYPGDSGESSEWLQGKTFKSKAILSFSLDGKTVTSAPFELTPHQH